jgi:hypothetical protein
VGYACTSSMSRLIWSSSSGSKARSMYPHGGALCQDSIADPDPCAKRPHFRPATTSCPQALRGVVNLKAAAIAVLAAMVVLCGLLVPFGPSVTANVLNLRTGADALPSLC